MRVGGVGLIFIYRLFLFTVYYCYKQIGVDYIVSVTDVKGGILMRQLFGFIKIQGYKNYYHKAKMKKSSAQILNLHQLKYFFRKHF